MADDASDLLGPRYVEASGPWHRDDYEFTVGGYRVPYIAASLKQGEDAAWLLTLDRRFLLEAADDEVQRWLPFVAHAMAIAAGYSCHGENCRPMNPFTVRVSEIGSDL